MGQTATDPASGNIVSEDKFEESSFYKSRWLLLTMSLLWLRVGSLPTVKKPALSRLRNLRLLIPSKKLLTVWPLGNEIFLSLTFPSLSLLWVKLVSCLLRFTERRLRNVLKPTSITERLCWRWRG